MQTFTWFITGGFAKGYRTQILGVRLRCPPLLSGPWAR